jgi:FKBP-type peptidyl-prolyl cis-trans isomerase FkpA
VSREKAGGSVISIGKRAAFTVALGYLARSPEESPMFKSPSVAAFVAAILVTCACAPPEAESQAPVASRADVGLDTDESRILYALGTALGSNLEAFALTEAELAIVTAGIADAIAGREPRVDMQMYGPRIQSLADERAAAAAAGVRSEMESFLAEMAAEPGAEVMDSGLIFIPITVGDGESPSASDSVNVHYHGTLSDGTVFDSSVERGETISFPLSGVIPCWTEGLQKMAVGGKAILVCPSDIAYGDRGSPPVIPGGAALKFEVELFAIE